MKKFLLLIFAMTILTATVEAADIPDIRLLNPNQIKLNNSISYNGKERSFYFFECTDKQAREYMTQYVDFLTKKLGYTIFKQKNYEWHLIYSGNENISPIVTKKTQYHVVVSGGKSYIGLEFVAGINVVGIQSKSEVQPQPAPFENNPPQVTPLSTNQTSGADVPDFLQVCDKNVTYSHNQAAGDGGTFYFYNAKTLNADLSNHYAEKYIRLLTGSYRFVQHNHEEKNFGKTKFDKWTFRYTGSKNVKASSGGYHLELKRFRDYEKNRVHFEFAVTKGLTVAGNYSSPRASGGNDNNYCSACGGSGRCSTCGGRGYYHYSDFDQPCGSCLTSGKCSYCNGTGRA